MEKISTTAKIKEYLIDFTSELGYFPTFQEIKDEFNLKSVSTVYYHLRALEKEGFIEQKNGKGKSYVIKNTGIFFKIPVSYTVQKLKISKINRTRMYLPVPQEMYNSFAIQVEDSSLSTYGINKGSFLFLTKADSETHDYVYIDKKDNITLSPEQIIRDDLEFLGCMYLNITPIADKA